MYLERYKKIKKLKLKGRVLDIGARDGILKDYIPECKYYGVDKYPDVTTIQKVDVANEKLPFKNEYFDYVIMLEVLEHLDNPIYCLNEVKRVLKRTGKIIGTVPNCYDWRIMLGALVGHWYCNFEHLCTHDKITITNLLEMAGFRVKISSYFFRIPKSKRGFNFPFLKSLRMYWYFEGVKK